ncbi:hypothetical protein X947_6085 [Burkholderia pseudomallei MSHR7334]|nr:hypothetical protein X947_6085 [Burkholderia pseudomallei MSHR7334]
MRKAAVRLGQRRRIARFVDRALLRCRLKRRTPLLRERERRFGALELLLCGCRLASDDRRVRRARDARADFLTAGDAGARRCDVSLRRRLDRPRFGKLRFRVLDRASRQRRLHRKAFAHRSHARELGLR